MYNINTCEGAGAEGDVVAGAVRGGRVAEESDGASGGMEEEGLENEVNVLGFFFFWNSVLLMGASLITARMHLLTDASKSRSLLLCCVCGTY